MKPVPLPGADHLLPHKYEAVSVPFAQEQTLFHLSIMLFMLNSEDVLWLFVSDLRKTMKKDNTDCKV